MAENAKPEEVKTEEVAEETKAPTKASKNEMKIAAEYGRLWLMENQSKEGKFKLVDELEEAEKALKKVKGLKAVESKTLVCKRVKLTIVKDMPVPKQFTDLFTAKQKKQYFK